MLYKLATGRAPIGGGDAFAVARGHADGLVRPPRDLDGAISPDLERVILRSLSKLPEDRYATAAAMQHALGKVVAGEPVTRPRTSVAAGKRPRSSLPWLLVSGIITVVATLLVLWLAGIIAGGVTVPGVTGLSVTEATARLRDEGLTVGELTYDDGDPAIAQDTVLSQDPTSGTEVDEGTAVDLVLAGTAPATVPDVTGLDQTAAAMALSAAGYLLGAVTPVADPDVAAGLVISQTPAAGEQASPGTAVAITISSGPPLPSYSPTPAATPTPTGLTPTSTPVTPTPVPTAPPSTPTVLTP